MKNKILICLVLLSFALIQAIAAQTDTDHDGIPANAEKILGTDPQTPDTDGDGINDLKDKHPLNADINIVKSRGPLGFKIIKILVEDNYDPAHHKDAPDHLEIFLKNVSGHSIGNFTVIYRITDEKTGRSQLYSLPLNGFTLKKGEKTSVHIDTKKGKNHFRTNPNSIYYQSQNKRRVDVIVNAKGFQSQGKSVQKDAGGAETAD